MKKKILILFIAILLPLSFVSAQQSLNLLSFEFGIGPSINVDSAAVSTYNHFGINLHIADPVTISATSGTTTSILLKYSLSDMLRLTVGYAGTTNTIIGFEFVPFTNQFTGITTEFKVATSYLFAGGANGITAGDLRFGLLLSVGF